MARGALVSMIVILLFASISTAHAENIITVDQSGHGDFYHIQDAINSIPGNNKEDVTISINPGTYKEMITVPPDKPFITLRGSNRKASDVIITWDKSDDIVKVATFHVSASDFTAHDVTFQNTFGRGHQAVALRVSGDRVAFYDCWITGYQDTLFDETGRHYYENCYIEGAVDFIFGSATSFYKNCHIHSAGGGFITAQRRENPTENGGFVFFKGSITGEHDKIYLGRPWVGSFARVIFAYTIMENVIEPAGWSNDGITEEELKAKSFCGQFKCDGPGASTSKRVQWAREFSEEDVAKFLTTDFINGKDWLKSTTVATPLSPPPLMKPSSPLPAPVVIPSSPPPAPVMIPTSPLPAPVVIPSSPPPAPVVIPSSPPPVSATWTMPPEVKPSSPRPAPVITPSSPPPAPSFSPPPPVVTPSSPPPAVETPLSPPAPVMIPSSSPLTPVIPWLAPPAPVTQPPPSPPPPSPWRVIITPMSPPSTSANGGGQEGEPIIMQYTSGASSHSKDRFSSVGKILGISLLVLLSLAFLGCCVSRRCRR